MEPITTALIAAAAQGVTKVGEKVVVEAYAGLKELIRRKFGKGSEVERAVEAVEAKPDSASRKAMLEEELTAVKAAEDGELVEAAKRLLAQLEQQPTGASIVQQARGMNIAQAAGGSAATVNVNQPKS